MFFHLKNIILLINSTEEEIKEIVPQPKTESIMDAVNVIF